jgi:lysophospholipase L1-like esterase
MGKNILLFISSFLIVLIFIEIILRFVNIESSRIYYPRYLWEANSIVGFASNKNNSTTLSLPHETIKYEINNLGLRGGEINKKWTHTTRILLLGDSITFGPGVNLESTWGKVFESHFNKYSPDLKVETLNLSTPGWGTYHELQFYKTMGEKLEEDVIVLQFCNNDIIDNMGKRKTVVYGYRVPDRKYKPLYFTLQWVYFHSKAFSIVMDRLKRISAVQDFLINPTRTTDFLTDKISDEWKVTENLILRISEYVEKRNKKLIVLSFDSNYDTNLMKLKKDYGIEVVLLRDNLRNFHLDSLLWDAHWNKKSHKIVGKELAKYLLKSDLLKLN